jgi:glucosylceramidase
LIQGTFAQRFVVKKRLGTVACVSLVFVAASCSSEPSEDGAGGAGGTNGTPTGGSNAAGSANAGKGSGTSGSAGTGNPGTAGTTAGTAPQAGTTGASGSGNPAGGTSGGLGGSGQAGSAGAPTGGTDPGAGGSAPVAGSGGDAPVAGGGGDGPVAGAGGTQAGSGGGAGAPPIEEPDVVTSVNNSFWKVGTLTEVTSGNADVTVTSSMSQTWTGFGGTFNEKGWDALSALSQADRDRAIKLLFDRADGANFLYGRIPIGASDYAMDRYTLNETAGDTAMNNFSIARDKERLIPYIKAALAVRSDIHFWGSPWTPPRWMKDNNAYDRGNMKDDNANLQAFALYLSKFVEEYGKEGITIKAIHPQNEPGYQQDYPSCSWSGSLYAKFIGQFLGPTFQERGITAEIFLGTMSNPTADATVLTTTQGNATAKAFIKGYGLQWGMADVYGNLNMDRNLAIWQTEHKCGNYPWEGGYQQTAPNDWAYGVESWGLLRDWIRRGVNAYSAWNMVLDSVGRSLDTVRPWAQNALLTVDISAKRLNITPAYYVFRHFSQYVDPGAKVAGTMGGDAIAFKNPDGSTVVVLYNSGGGKMMTVDVGGKKFQFDMPGAGWATVNAH